MTEKENLAARANNGSPARLHGVGTADDEGADDLSSAPREKDWAELEEPIQARMNGTTGRSVASFTPMGSFHRSMNLPGLPNFAGAPAQISAKQRRPNLDVAPATGNGLKRRTARQVKQDMPPVPRGCEWRRSDDGWNLWRSWSEADETGSGRIKKSRYAGYLTNEAWEIMKEYDHEAFLAVVGERLRRHSKR